MVDFRERFDGTGTGFEYPMTLRVWNPFTGDEVALEELQAGARATHFEERFLIVAEPEKGIHFFDLRNSSAITHRVFELPLTYGLDSLHAARFQNQLVVFSNGEADGKNVRSPLLYDPIRISRISAPVNGFVYGFDIKTGELLWDKPGQLYNMTFPTIQPTDSPFMLLYQVHERTKLASCAMIDIRYGSFVFAEHLLQADTDGFSMRLLPLKQQIVANVGMKGLLISFSDSTRAPQPVFSFRAR